MKKKIKYIDDFDGANLKDMVRVPDFFPSLAELAGNAKKTRVTLELHKKDVDFFKKTAKKLGASYQQMIRNLVSQYAARFREATV